MNTNRKLLYKIVQLVSVVILGIVLFNIFQLVNVIQGTGRVINYTGIIRGAPSDCSNWKPTASPRMI